MWKDLHSPRSVKTVYDLGFCEEQRGESIPTMELFTN